VELSKVMRTSGAVREFTADDQVQPSVLYRVLDNARFAPSGGNQQGWHVIVVRDPTLRRRLADLSVAAFQRYVAEQSAGYRAFSVVDSAPIDVEIPDGIPTDQQRRASVGLAVTSEDGAQRSAVVVLVAEGHNGPVRPGRTPVCL
jgi:nitroreductase